MTVWISSRRSVSSVVKPIAENSGSSKSSPSLRVLALGSTSKSMASCGDRLGPAGRLSLGAGEENSFRIGSVAGTREKDRGKVSLPGVNTSRSTIGDGLETRFLLVLGGGNCCISS